MQLLDWSPKVLTRERNSHNGQTFTKIEPKGRCKFVHPDGRDVRYYNDGVQHRDDGPAVVIGNVIAWCYKDYCLEDIDDFLSINDSLTDEEKVYLKLKYG